MCSCNCDCCKKCHPVIVDKSEVIKNIIEVYETGKISKNYGTTTILEDGAGISYGKSQATDKSNTLDAIVFRYIDKKGMYAASLEQYLDELQSDLTTKANPRNPPAWVRNLMMILEHAGNLDPKMKEAQDEIFDELYWQPAQKHITSMKLILPLSHAVVYDSCIHSGSDGVNKIRRLFSEVPPANNGDERKWTEAYVRARRAWLANYPTVIVRKTVYRMDYFLEMIKDVNWQLDKPLTIMGVRLV